MPTLMNVWQSYGSCEISLQLPGTNVAGIGSDFQSAVSTGVLSLITSVVMFGDSAKEAYDDAANGNYNDIKKIAYHIAPQWETKLYTGDWFGDEPNHPVNIFSINENELKNFTADIQINKNIPNGVSFISYGENNSCTAIHIGCREKYYSLSCYNRYNQVFIHGQSNSWLNLPDEVTKDIIIYLKNRKAFDYD